MHGRGGLCVQRRVVQRDAEEFARELRYLRQNLDVISVAELLGGLQKPALLPARPAVITFDDGYRDNGQIAAPLLREAGLTACFFLCSGIVGTDKIPWYERFVCCLKKSESKTLTSPFGNDDSEYDLTPGSLGDSIRRFRANLRRLTWPELEKQLSLLEEVTRVRPEQYLQERVFFVGRSETDGCCGNGDRRSHANSSDALRALDAETLRDEVAGSREDLTDRLGMAPRAFAYPFGSEDAMSHEADEEIRATRI